MDDRLDPRVALARRLRELRQEHWPGGSLTQLQLARALGEGNRWVSVPAISSWESVSDPKIPTVERLGAYATFFATPRSIAGEPRLLNLEEMTDEEERQAREVLLQELMQLREAAVSISQESRRRVDDRLDPRVALARRLRELRQEHWSGGSLTQLQLARALGGSYRGLSVPAISSWESVSDPKIPTVERLGAYATFFATPRSIAGEPRLLNLEEMTDEERQAREVLLQELMQLRETAQRIPEILDPPGVSNPWNMPESEKPLRHVFISYVREDSNQVDRLQRTMQAAGIPVWRDTADLWPGEDWRVKIRSAITDNALVFIACFSRASLGRDKSYQNEELTLAIDQLRLRRPDDPWLIPVRFDECDIPNWDIGGGRGLASIQRADLFRNRFDEGTGRLLMVIKHIFEKEAAF